jgi:hypothetical protein
MIHYNVAVEEVGIKFRSLATMLTLGGFTQSQHIQWTS